VAAPHDNRPEELDAIEACTRGSMALGALAQAPDASESADEPEPPRASRRARGRHLGEAEGFSIHGVTAAAGNVHGRELLLRYCARPPIALGRLSKLPDGRIAYRLKKPWRPDQTHVVFTPLEFLARVAALVPPPRSPLIRFHGAFAAHARDRPRVVVAGPSQPPPTSAGSAGQSSPEGSSSEAAVAGAKVTQQSATPSPLATPAEHPSTPQSAEAVVPAPPEPHLITRIDWATLLQRVHDVDALACPCGGRLEFLELVTTRDEAAPVLERLGFAATPPAISPRSATPDFDDLSAWQPSAWDP
jgi:hypothetical protein